MYFTEEQGVILRKALESREARQLLDARKEATNAERPIVPDKAFVTRILPGTRCIKSAKHCGEFVVVDTGEAELAPSAKAPKDAWGNVTAGLYKALAGRL